MHVPNVTIPIWDRARALDEGAILLRIESVTGERVEGERRRIVVLTDLDHTSPICIQAVT